MKTEKCPYCGDTSHNLKNCPEKKWDEESEGWGCD